MEPIGICGGGVVALFLFLIAVVGVALLAGGIALALAKLGVAIDAWFKPERRGEADVYTLDQGTHPDDSGHDLKG